MSILIQPRLTMAAHVPVRNTEPHNFQTIAEVPIPVVVPALSIRSRVALAMQIVALWLMVTVVITSLCLLNLSMVYSVVLAIIVLLTGCMFTGMITTHQYRKHLPEAPTLMTQQVRAITKSDIASLARTVSMRTSGYLVAVRSRHA